MERLSKAIKTCKHSRYEIHKATGVDQSVLHRIVNGGSCNIETADVLCEYLGIELVQKKHRKAR